MHLFEVCLNDVLVEPVPHCLLFVVLQVAQRVLVILFLNAIGLEKILVGKEVLWYEDVAVVNTVDETQGAWWIVFKHFLIIVRN